MQTEKKRNESAGGPGELQPVKLPLRRTRWCFRQALGDTGLGLGLSLGTRMAQEQPLLPLRFDAIETAQRHSNLSILCTIAVEGLYFGTAYRSFAL